MTLKFDRLIDDVLIHPSTAEDILVLTINRALTTAVHDDMVDTSAVYETPWACGMTTPGEYIMPELDNDDYSWVIDV